MQHIFKHLLLTTALLFSLTSTLFSATDCQKVFNVQNFVQRFYVQVLDREAEHAGLDDWTNKLTSGQKSGADVAYGFAFSQEYLDKHSSNSSYLTTLYKSFFNREPDSAGLNYWLAQIAEGMSREEVLHGFVYSKEFETLSASYGIKAYEDESKESKGLSSFIQRFYQVILGREADKAGLDDWVAKLSAGSATGADIAEGFVFSAEYDEQSKEDSAFIATLYRAFFNREPDTAGLAGWKTVLLGGTSRKEVLQGFLHSQEFVNLSNTYGIRAYEGATQTTPSTQSSNTLTEMPYAKATVDHTSITETNPLHFSATQSHANVGSLVCTLWSEQETLLSEETAYTTNTLTVGTHKLHLMVVDSQGMCASDSVSVEITESTIEPTPPPTDTTLQSLSLQSSATSTVNVGDTVTLSVVGTYADNSSKTLTSNIEYLITPSQSVRLSANTLEVLKDGSVTVQATVDGVKSNTINLDIIWVVNAHTLPPEPDKVVNDATLLGVDSNNNGVRDDVERWIYEEYKDKHPIHIDIAMQAARGYRLVLEKQPKMKEEAKEIYPILDASTWCEGYYSLYAKYFNKSILVHENISTNYFRKHIYFNTEERMNTYILYDKVLSGDTYATPQVDENMTLYCDFNTSKYEE